MIRYVQGWSNLIKPRGLYWENFHQFFQYICLITMYWFLFTLLAFHIIKQTPDCATRYVFCVTDGKTNIFPALFNQRNMFCHYLIKLFKMYTLVSKQTSSKLMTDHIMCLYVKRRVAIPHKYQSFIIKQNINLTKLQYIFSEFTNLLL